MIKAPAPNFGRSFGFGTLAISIFACSGSTFGTAPNDSEGGDSSATVMTHGGKSTTAPTGGSAGRADTGTGGVVAEGDGGAAPLETQPRPTRGGSNAGGGAGGALGTAGDATAGSATAGSGGGSVHPPEQGGAAGEPNIPDPPLNPKCSAPLADGWTAAMGSAGSQWQVVFGDPSIDVANHRLVVSYDDVAGRNAIYEGGYYITAEATLEGGTVLTPYPHANEMRWPSLRRSLDGSSVELGASRYGTSEVWTTNDWPGFSGVSIAGTKTVTVTAYVKAGAKAFAVKVSHGGQSYRSGWISGFTWPETNLGIMRYVGENNSRVYSSGDAVYVGPLRGCQRLSDAAVTALFEN